MRRLWRASSLSPALSAASKRRSASSTWPSIIRSTPVARSRSAQGIAFEIASGRGLVTRPEGNAGRVEIGHGVVRILLHGDEEYFVIFLASLFVGLCDAEHLVDTEVLRVQFQFPLGLLDGEWADDVAHGVVGVAQERIPIVEHEAVL